MLTWPFKDPDEVLDYIVDWSDRIETDTIATSVFTVPAGLTKASESHDATAATVWLSGGTLAASYEILNRIVTAGGRTMDQTIRLKIKTK